MTDQLQKAELEAVAHKQSIQMLVELLISLTARDEDGSIYNLWKEDVDLAERYPLLSRVHDAAEREGITPLTPQTSS